MASIYLVRHGQASFGSENYDQLSELGQRQCLLLGQWMQQTGQPVETIYVGAMQRHQQSAEAFVAGYGAPAHLHAQHWQLKTGLNEFDHEQVIRRSRPELGSASQLLQFLAQQTQPRQVFETLFATALTRWMQGEHADDYAESWNDFKQRVHTALLELVPQTTPANNSIVFTSGGPISALCQHFLAIPDTHVMSLLAVLINSSVTRIVHSDGQCSLANMNTIAHLEQHNDRRLISFR